MLLAPVVDMGATPTFPTPLIPASVSLKPMRTSFSSPFLRRPQILHAKIPATARMMAPPTPTTTPMIVFLVVADMPELPPELPPPDRLAVGVDTVSEVELMTEPSDRVTTMIVVWIVGVWGVGVIWGSVDWSDEVPVAAGFDEVGVSVVPVLPEAGVVGVAAGGSDVAAAAAEGSEADGVLDEGELPLPVESACLLPSSLLNCLTSWLNREPSTLKAWVAVVADRAATSSFSMLVESMVYAR